MAGKTKYRVIVPFATDSRQYKADEVAELTDAEAKYFNKHNAIGLYIGDGDEAPDDLPKPRRKVRDARNKPDAPTPLDDSKLLDPDPRAR